MRQRRSTRAGSAGRTDWQGDATERSDYAGDLLDGGGPPPGPLTIEVVSGCAAVVTLGGEHDVASRDAIAEAFGVAATGRDLLVDLSECSFIDSTIIKLLLHTMRSLEDRDGRLELVIDIGRHGSRRARGRADGHRRRDPDARDAQRRHPQPRRRPHALEPVRLEQAQPQLAARGERRHRVPEIVQRDLGDDGDRGRVQRLGDLGAGDRRADDDAPLLVDDEPRTCPARRGR